MNNKSRKLQSKFKSKKVPVGYSIAGPILPDKSVFNPSGPENGKIVPIKLGKRKNQNPFFTS